jgi:hypothetical protein
MYLAIGSSLVDDSANFQYLAFDKFRDNSETATGKSLEATWF